MEQRPIDLQTFRRVNNITQGELADFLGVTRGFISLIENGKAKLPDDKQRLIMTKGKEEMGWDVEELIPAYKRILILMDLQRSRLKAEGVDDEVELNNYSIIGIPGEACMRILEGKGTFTQTIAEQVKSKIPDINIKWLLTGEGDILVKDKPGYASKLQQDIKKLYTEIRSMKNELMQVKEMLQKMEARNSQP